MKQLSILISLVLLISASVAAQRYEIDADAMTSKVVDGELVLVLEGNARISHPLAELEAAKIQVKRQNKELAKIFASGKPLKASHRDPTNREYQIEAEKLELDSLSGKINLSGNIKLTQKENKGATTIIIAESIMVSYQDGQISNVDIKGGDKPLQMDYQSTENNASFNAEARLIEYATSNAKVTLHDVELKRQGETISAALIEFDPKTGAITAPRRPGSRVTITKEFEEKN